jgi:hypothetical protein
MGISRTQGCLPILRLMHPTVSTLIFSQVFNEPPTKCMLKYLQDRQQ